MRNPRPSLGFGIEHDSGLRHYAAGLNVYVCKPDARPCRTCSTRPRTGLLLQNTNSCPDVRQNHKRKCERFLSVAELGRLGNVWLRPIFESSSGHHLFFSEHPESIDKVAEICHFLVVSV